MAFPDGFVLVRGGVFVVQALSCGHYLLPVSSAERLLLQYSFRRLAFSFLCCCLQENGTYVSLARRERHQVLVNDAGVPTHLFNGVIGDQEGKGGSADYSYTMVQALDV